MLLPVGVESAEAEISWLSGVFLQTPPGLLQTHGALKPEPSTPQSPAQSLPAKLLSALRAPERCPEPAARGIWARRERVGAAGAPRGRCLGAAWPGPAFLGQELGVPMMV